MEGSERINRYLIKLIELILLIIREKVIYQLNSEIFS